MPTPLFRDSSSPGVRFVLLHTKQVWTRPVTKVFDGSKRGHTSSKNVSPHLLSPSNTTCEHFSADSRTTDVKAHTRTKTHTCIFLSASPDNPPAAPPLPWAPPPPNRSSVRSLSASSTRCRSRRRRCSAVSPSCNRVSSSACSVLEAKKQRSQRQITRTRRMTRQQTGRGSDRMREG